METLNSGHRTRSLLLVSSDMQTQNCGVPIVHRILTIVIDVVDDFDLTWAVALSLELSQSTHHTSAAIF